jgi:hypothetical protein
MQQGTVIYFFDRSREDRNLNNIGLTFTIKKQIEIIAFFETIIFT